MSEQRPPEPRVRRPRPAQHQSAEQRADEPVLPEVSGDDGDEGWGDDPRERRRDEQWYRRERPPHHE